MLDLDHVGMPDHSFQVLNIKFDGMIGSTVSDLRIEGRLTYSRTQQSGSKPKQREQDRVCG